MADIASFSRGRSPAECDLTKGLATLQPVAVSLTNGDKLQVMDYPPQFTAAERRERLNTRLARLARAVVLPARLHNRPWPQHRVAAMFGNGFRDLTLLGDQAAPAFAINHTVRFDRTPWPEHASPNLDDPMVGAWVPLDGAAGDWVIVNPDNLLAQRTCQLLGAWAIQALKIASTPH